MGLVRNSRKMSEGPITYSYSENRDPLSALYAIMERILEWGIEVPNEIVSGLIEEIKCKL
jgi:hypothetical protein